MNREVHVGFCEGLGVKLPWATRLGSWLIFGFLVKYLEFSLSLKSIITFISQFHHVTFLDHVFTRDYS